MKTAFVGAGRGCLAVLELLVQGRLDILDLEVLAVVDIDPEAPGSRFARQLGWPTLTDIEEALALPSLQLVIELTGSDEVLDRIYSHLPPGVRVMDHVMARVFWDLEKLATTQRDQLREKARLEARLEAEHAELRAILDTIPDVVIVLDQEMRTVRANKRFEEVTGLGPTEVERLLLRQAFLISETGERSVDLVAPFSAVIETQQPFDEVQVIAGVDGAERLFHVTASPILGDSGDVVRVVQTAREVTELVRLQRASEEQSQRFRQIVDAVHGIITIKGLDGRYQLVNPRAERFFGMTGDDMIGRTASELFSAPNAAIIKANDEKMFEAGTYQTSEETLALDGGERTLMSERFPLRDYRGQVVALCCVARDMTRTRQLQQELVQSERLAAMGKLAAGVAHEINNPLTGILTFAEDLKLEAEVDDPRRADYEVIINETLRCRRIVRDLLDYSRQTAPERQQTPVGPVIQRMLAMIERQATFHNIRFKVDVETGLPEVYIDPRQIQQALLNLVINARDAMDGVGELQICARPHAEEGWIAIEVVDHGCGIESEHLDDIFQPFFSTKGGQGNGLGLPAVLSLAEQHGGRVEVQSEVGVGSTFSILLPAAGVPSRESLHGK